MDHSTSGKHVRKRKGELSMHWGLCLSLVPQQTQPHAAGAVGCSTNITGLQQKGETVWRVIVCAT